MQLEKSLGRASAGTGAVVDFSGVWTNELKSEATIEQNGDVLKGSCESTVSDNGQKTKGSLQGYVDGDLISFSVHWNEFQAITAWVGQLEPGNTETLKTLWQMTKQVVSGGEWASINAGSDVFTRQR